MTEVPSVSIVIPVWNSERFLATTLASVQIQTMQNWELVIVDDGSHDRSLTIAHEFAHADPRIRVYSQPNAGVALSRNAGYAATDNRTPFVIFLDHDDVWAPETLSILSGSLSAHPEAPAAYGMTRSIDAAGRVRNARPEDEFGFLRYGLRNGRVEPIEVDALTTFEVLAIWPWFETPGQMLMRRSALEKAREPTGLFDPRVRGSDDWELAIRLTLQGGIVRVLDRVLDKREHDANTFNLPGYMRTAHVIRDKLFTAPVYQTKRDVAKQATLASIRVQFSWVFPNLRRLRLRLALGQSARALRAYWRYLRLVSVVSLRGP